MNRHGEVIAVDCGGVSISGTVVGRATSHEPGATRWTEVTVYLDGQAHLAAHVVGRSTREGESDRHAVYMGRDRDELLRQARSVRRLVEAALA